MASSLLLFQLPNRCMFIVRYVGRDVVAERGVREIYYKTRRYGRVSRIQHNRRNRPQRANYLHELCCRAYMLYSTQHATTARVMRTGLFTFRPALHVQMKDKRMYLSGTAIRDRWVLLVRERVGVCSVFGGRAGAVVSMRAHTYAVRSCGVLRCSRTIRFDGGGGSWTVGRRSVGAMMRASCCDGNSICSFELLLLLLLLLNFKSCLEEEGCIQRVRIAHSVV